MPERIITSKSIIYLVKNIFHRNDGPAVIQYNGGMLWYDFGVVSAAPNPAIIDANGFMTFECRAHMNLPDVLHSITENGKRFYHE